MTESCPICAEPFVIGDRCAIDVEMGTCHAACLEGSPVVDLDTGEPAPDLELLIFTWGSDEAIPGRSRTVTDRPAPAPDLPVAHLTAAERAYGEDAGEISIVTTVAEARMGGGEPDPILLAAQARGIVSFNTSRLIAAAEELVAACHDADAREELDMAIDGSMLDAVTDAIKEIRSAAPTPTPAGPDYAKHGEEMEEALREAQDYLGATFGPVDGDTSDKRRWSDEEACNVARQVDAILSKLRGEA